MPIARDSDTWQNAQAIDRLGTNIADNLLLENPEQAYTIEEIVEWVRGTHPENIPRAIRAAGRDEDVIVLVRAVLDRLERRNFVQARRVEEDGEPRIYYASREDDSLYPSVEIRHEVIPRLENLEDEVEALKG